MTILNTILAFIVALGCLIVIHELGHYLVARWCGVKVLRFSVGFGRPLWSRRFGPDQTEWVVAAVPLGGYVKMLDENEGGVAQDDLPRAFNRQSVGRRFAIVAAGPVANFLLAIVLYWMLFVYGMPGITPMIGPAPVATPAAVAGFRAGDTLLKVGAEPVQSWQDARWLLLQHAVARTPVEIEVREEAGPIRTRTLEFSSLEARDLEGDFLRALGLSRYRPRLDPVIGSVLAGSPAQRAGLRPGDRVVAMEGREPATWEDLVSTVRSHPAKPLSLDIRRSDLTDIVVTITPDAVAEGGVSVGRIGAGPRVDPAVAAGLTVEVRYGVLESLGQAVYKTWDTAWFSLQMLGRMIVGQVSLRNLSGPITIADYAGQSAQAGWISYCLFLALISISLGVLNLLPIPLLDGGHLMYYMFEIIKGRPVSDRVLAIGQQMGVALLFILMAFALYNDINRLLAG